MCKNRIFCIPKLRKPTQSEIFLTVCFLIPTFTIVILLEIVIAKRNYKLLKQRNRICENDFKEFLN